LVLLTAVGCGKRASVLNTETALAPGYPLPTQAVAPGAEVELRFATGATVKGDVLAVEGDSLILDGVERPVEGDPPLSGAAKKARLAVHLGSIERGSWKGEGGSQPLVVLATGGALELRRAELWIGDRFHWRTHEKATGAGYLAAVAADSLILDSRSPFRRGGEVEETHLALASLEQLTWEDRQTEKAAGKFLGIPIVVAGVLFIAVMGVLAAGLSGAFGS
jgi:hypothetical protein